jgi:nucleotide-binding universal stress UspA family protein
MPGLFKNILVPVDFSDNTEIAITQAIKLSCTTESIIHLLHVTDLKDAYSINFIFGQLVSPQKNKGTEKITGRLQQWKQAIEETDPNKTVVTHITKGAVENSIKNLAEEIKPQLIIVGKKPDKKHTRFFNSVCPNHLAKTTGCPVLTVMRRTIDTKIKVIVVPVGSFIPKRKIGLVVEFAKLYRAEIHLVAIPDISNKKADSNPFLETYRILKANLTNSIEYHLLRGNNFPKAILDYAERIGADLIFVNPGTETRISIFTGKHINDALKTSSKLKILSLEPYHDNKPGIY